MDFFNVVTIDEANEIIKKNFFNYNFEFETVDLLNSTDRILADDIISEIDVPEFNRSTVDGYSIIVEDSHGATASIPSILTVMGEVRMGENPKSDIISGQAIYTPTGGMLPSNATGVIMIENTELMDDETLLLYKPISKGENIIFKGDDIRKGDIALKRGMKLSPEAIGVLASLGISKVNVYKKPRFYIISTGDEIIDIDEELSLGKVRDINTYALYSLIEKLGCEVVGKNIVKDDYDLLRSEVDKGLELADVVLLSGGSSVGTRDYTDKVIASFGGKGVLVHGLAIKPGKPTIVGEGNGKLIMGLPGHPVSSIVVFKAIVEEYIRGKLGNNEILPQVKAITEYNFPSSPGKTTYHMVRLRQDGDKYYATPTFGKSGMISLLSESQGYIVIKEHEEGIYKGEERIVYLL
ncbi:gephyrin-like molybdotransferase Glp [Tissierella sp. Yu-01]|uniref:molybdopterin molybdotransferase MoeA n=1 Tax=Tissierella sp. Yu-01 TaxID=3035694 RepID=UPI00240D87A7|nr:gephyrin-like molybdotransferase Glp [Tissierella sp. Yu-01]WFA08183.1 molybdopterin molybdotransferase MoeA [Tissierella sp. Yu-01]